MKPDVFDRLFDEHAEALLAFLTYRVGDRATAEDVLADTFERALRSRKRLDPRRGDGRAWLYAIALNVVRDRARRRAAEERALGRLGEPDERGGQDALGHIEARQTVSEALETLSDDERETIALRYGADMTVPEIARLLKLPDSTIEGRVHRALRKMRARLDPEAQEAPAGRRTPSP